MHSSCERHIKIGQRGQDGATRTHLESAYRRGGRCGNGMFISKIGIDLGGIHVLSLGVRRYLHVGASFHIGYVAGGMICQLVMRRQCGGDGAASEAL